MIYSAILAKQELLKMILLNSVDYDRHTRYNIAFPQFFEQKFREKVPTETKLTRARRPRHDKEELFLIMGTNTIIKSVFRIPRYQGGYLTFNCM